MRRLLLALLLLVPLLACGGDDADPLAEDGGADESEVAEGLTVLDPGAEPRRALRLDPPGDCLQRVTMRQELTQTVSAEGTEQSSNQGTAYDVTHRCTEVTEERITVSTTFDAVRLLHSDIDNPQLDEMLQAMEGAASETTYDRQGGVVDAELPDLELEGEMGAVLGPMFDQLGEGLTGSTAALPRDPMGLGGRWQTSGVIEAGGIRMRQVTVHRIVELTEDLVRTEVTTEMEVLDASFDLPGMDPDTEVSEVTGSFTGSGTAEWDLHGVVPVQSMVTDGTMRMEMSVKDDPFVLEQTQHQEMSTTLR